MNKIREVKASHKEFKIDKMFSDHGHTILRLPPYHPDLNPIEEVWGVKKRRVASENVVQENSKVEQLIEKHFSDPSIELWTNCVKNAIKNETEYFLKDLNPFNIIFEDEENLWTDDIDSSSYSENSTTDTADETFE